MSVIRNPGPIVVTQGRKGFEAVVGPFGETIVAASVDNISAQFQYNIYPGDATSSTTGDGAVVQEASYAKLSSTTGTSSLISRDTLRYKPGHTALARFTGSFVGGGIGEIGIFDADDGAFIRCTNGSISVLYRNAGVDVEVLEADLNGDDLSEIDWTKINVFSITLGWLGVAPIVFEVMRSDGGWLTIHKFKTAGKLTTTHLGNPVVPMQAATSGEMEIKTASWNGQILGSESIIGQRPFSFPTVGIVNGTAPEQGEMTLTGTNVGTIVIFNSKSTFQGKTNKVKARLTGFEFGVDIPGGVAIGTVVFQIIGSPTLSGTPTYTDVSASGSILQYDHTPATGASVTYIGGTGTPVLTTEVQYSGANKGGISASSQIDAERIGAFAYANDVFAIVAKDLGGNNVTVRVTLNWEELF